MNESDNLNTDRTPVTLQGGQQFPPHLTSAPSATDADIAFWAAQLGRPVSKSEADEIEHDLKALVTFLVEVEK